MLGVYTIVKPAAEDGLAGSGRRSVLGAISVALLVGVRRRGSARAAAR